ncbi:MAG: hypothetical protein UR23_C0051G0003 [Candidatus Roizmanbacteria bacterium GW2011_GWA2_32_13]|uniref:Protein containing DUF497 n=1 Tax=Candidatus Roizmanbacteria bacterium GW2011_GWA2_32_13 TaxID=1618475 RepID=A0A0F9YNM9_9BACT|nr:MAG: hypothetical protein UR23_C0051G0003 [Candidatus Roizmanbacteria bacterium GW2011_GWA2_32_13]
MFIQLNFDDIDGFDWDDANIKKNEIKHEVYYKECEQIFFDKPFYIRDIKHSKIEERYYVFGETTKKRSLIITFTIRTRKIRVITARNQDKKEKEFYKNNYYKLSK